MTFLDELDINPFGPDPAAADSGSVLDDPGVRDDGDGQSRKPSQATLLVDLARSRYRFGQTLEGDPFAVDPAGQIARMLRGQGSLRAELARTFVQIHGRVPSQSALADALCVLEGDAIRSEPEGVELRIADRDGQVCIDLGDPAGTTGLVDPGGWRTTTTGPVLWRRTVLTGEIPAPQRGGDLDELRRLLNVTDEGFDLVVAWLVAGLIAPISHPVLAAVGEQGTGKTSAVRMLVELVDPSPAPLRTAPRDETGWAVAAAGSWVVALDNVSTLPPWLQDTICRAVTGDGMVRRRLYTDDGLSVLAFRRVVALTTIDPGAMRGDLGDRLLLLELERIPAHARRLERDLRREFDTLRPRLFGALLDLLVSVLGVLPSVELGSMPRMADFARVCAAVDTVRGSRSLAAYEAGAAHVAEAVVDSDPVADRVHSWIEDVGSWAGTAAALLAELTTTDRPSKGWPTTPQHLSGRLKRAAPALREVGVAVDFGEGRSRRIIRVERARESASPSSPPSRVISDLPKRGDGARDGGDTRTVTAGTSPSRRESAADLLKRAAGDGGDAGDDQLRLLSADTGRHNGNGTPCIGCGEPCKVPDDAGDWLHPTCAQGSTR